MPWEDKGLTWGGVETALLDAFRGVAQLPPNSVQWDGSAESGSFRPDPRIDIWIQTVDELGLEEVHFDWNEGTDRFDPKVDSLNRLILSLKLIGDESGTSTQNLVMQIRRRMRTRPDVKASLRAVGISLEEVHPTAVIDGEKVDSREYTILVTDFQFLYIEREVDLPTGDSDWFNRVALTFTEDVGPPPDQGIPMHTPVQINPLGINLPMGRSEVRTRSYATTETGSVVMRETRYLCLRTNIEVYFSILPHSDSYTEAGTACGDTWDVVPSAGVSTLILTATTSYGGGWTWEHLYLVRAL